MAMYLSNAFSINMLPQGYSGNIEIKWLPKSAMQYTVNKYPHMVYAVGHENTASLYSFILDYPITHNRIDVQLKPGDILYIGQYNGPRLPEGCKQLPEGATITWYQLTVN